MDEVRSLDDAGGEQPDNEVVQLREQIEETRSQMGETIDAIQDKLSIANISEEVSERVTSAVETAKDAVYNATIGKAADMFKDLNNTTAVRTVRNNPLPFILIGFGTGLLAYQTMSGRRSGNGSSMREERVRGPQPGTVDTVSRGLSSAGETVSDAAGNAYGSVSGAIQTAYSSASDAAHRAYDAVGDLKTTARDQYDRYLDESPLALGAVAMALGAAVGMAIPSTRYEGELLGPAKQQLLDKAQAGASGLLDKTREAVSEAGRGATAGEN